MTPGIYKITERLTIKQTTALVGTKNGDTLPTIKTTKALVDQKYNDFSLAYLSKETSLSSKGFYSAFINWDTSIAPDEQLASFHSGYMIYSNGYQGEIRLHGNTFSHSNEHDDIYLSDIVYLKKPGGPAYIDSNTFNTSHVHYSAVDSDCTNCGELDPEIHITANKLTSDQDETDTAYAFSLSAHRKFVINDNTQQTSQAAFSIEIDLLNEPGLQASISRNIANKDAIPSIEVSVLKDFMDDDKVSGQLDITYNDNFDRDDIDLPYHSEGYIRFIESPKSSSTSQALSSPTSVPAPLPMTGASTTAAIEPTSSINVPTASSSASPSMVTNPCDALSHDAAARKTCNDFLSNHQATGGDKDFSHVTLVSDVPALLSAVEEGHLYDGKPFAGTIVILRSGTYALTRPLRISHKVALVGEKSGTSLPEIKAGKAIAKQSHQLNSLVHLTKGSSQTASGFFSTQILWDASLDTDQKDAVCKAAIKSTHYPGKIRIFDNRFNHQGTKSVVFDYLKFTNSHGDTYIGSNTFDTTYLKNTAIDAHCSNCLNFNPKLEIISNTFDVQKGSTRKTVAGALAINGYKRFWIEGNQQKNAKAAAYIKVGLLNNTSGLKGFIRNNIALRETPAKQRHIKIESNTKIGQSLNISGSLTTTPNTYYSIDDPEGLVAHIGTSISASIQEPSASYQSTPSTPVVPAPTSIKPTPTGQAVAKTSTITPTPRLATTTQPSTTQATKICDTLKSTSNIIQTCKDFLENKNASEGGTFSKAVVVTNAKELIDAVTEKHPTGQPVSDKIVILQHGTYELPHTLEITHGIALVGETRNNTSSVSASGSSSVTYPVIRAEADFSALGYNPETFTYTEQYNKKALAYLHNGGGSQTTGFFSHHIHWETTHPSGKHSILFNGAINSQSYAGKIRLYQNQFSQTNASRIHHFINLINATGGAYINDNKFDTSNTHNTAIYAYCQKESCQTNNPPLEINSNHFHAQSEMLFGQKGAIHTKGYSQFKIIGNIQETKYAFGQIYVENHKNKQQIDAYIQNNRAHPEATERQREIKIYSAFSPDEPVEINGKIHISGNANYKYDDEGYTLDHVDYTPYKGTVSTQIALSATPTVNTVASTYSLPVLAGSITPTQLLVSVTASASTLTKKYPCDDIKDDETAFAACDAFLKSEKASGPASSKPSFSHAFIVNSADSLKDAIEKERYDGKPFIGSIIILRPGSYQLSQPLLISHRVALIGEKDENDKLPTLQAADDFHVPSGGGYRMVYLHNSLLSQDSGFYSTDLHWQARIPVRLGDSMFLSIIHSSGYKGEVRLYNNLFDHADQNSEVLHFLNLEENANQRIYIGNNTFDTSHVSGSTITSSGPYGRNNKARINIESNTFTTSEKTVNTDIKAIDLFRYQYLSIKDNIQKTSLAAGSIEVAFNNYSEIKEASIRNNKANKDATETNRILLLKLIADIAAPIAITGSVDLSGNQNYKFETSSNFPAANYDRVPYKAVATTSKSISTSTKQAAISSTIQPTPAQSTAITQSIAPTSPPAAICDSSNIVSSLHVTSSEIDACKAFLKNEKASAGRSFDIAVVVDNASELTQAVTGHFLTAKADDSKLIVLKNGTYWLPNALQITHKIALVGVVKDGSYPVIRAADNFSILNLSHNDRALAYLYDDPAVVTKKGFYSHHIHWDTTNPSDKVMLLLNGAINSLSYEGEFRIYENQFSESKHDYTSSYIHLIDATGATYINSNRFDTAYLRKAAIFAYCSRSNCVTTPTQLEISSNYFHSKVVSDKTDIPKMMSIEGYVQYKILDNKQETKDAAGTIYVKDHSNTLHMDAYIENNIAHKEAPESQRRILVESFFTPEKALDITGKLHVSGNDYYKFKESGLEYKYVTYSPGKSLAPSQTVLPTPTQSVTAVYSKSSAYVFPGLSLDTITPTQVLASASVTASITVPAKKPVCNDIADDATAFAACEAFLKSEEASGPKSSKPTFTHAFTVDSPKSLLEKVKMEQHDGKAVSGRIIVLKPGTYKLSEPLQPSHRMAFVGLKSSDGKLPVIKPADTFKVPSGSINSMLHLKAGNVKYATVAGFYSSNLEWATDLFGGKTFYEFESIIYAERYNGDIRFYNNRFSHLHGFVWSRYSVLMSGNSGHKYYIGHNTIDTSATITGVVKSSARNSKDNQADIEVEFNEFSTTDKAVSLDAEAIFLSGYQRLKINDNTQKDKHAAGTIEITVYNHEPIKSAIIRNNTAHKDAPEKDRTIELRLSKNVGDPDKVTGAFEVKDNDYYEFSYSDLPKANFHHKYGKRVGLEPTASPALSTTPSVSPTSSHSVSEVTATPATQPAFSKSPTNPVTRKTGPAPSEQTQPLPKSTVQTKTPPSFTSLCKRLKGTLEARYCEEFQVKLKKQEINTTFSEVVVVKNSDELVKEVVHTPDLGKIILLHNGNYELDQALHIRKKIALVGMGNPVIKSANIVYPAAEEETYTLALLNDEVAIHGATYGFYTKGITWDISAPDNTEVKPYSSAIKAVNHPGDIVILDDSFQYQSTRDNEEAPSHYIDIQKSTGNVRIADNTFFTGGLKESAIYANCKDCLKDNQYIDIVGNHFTDTEKVESTLVAIDVRYYKNLNIHRNVQETASATAQINVVLPNHKDDINAVIKDNLALAASDAEKRTIFLTIDKLVKAPASIGGSVRVFNNQCYFIRDYGIPSHVLDIIQGGCSATAHAQGGTQTSGGLSTGEWGAIGGGALLTLLYGGAGIYGCTDRYGHEVAHQIFIFPKTAVVFVASQITNLYHKTRGYNPQGAQASIKFNELKRKAENEQGFADPQTEPLVEPGDENEAATTGL
ncbi:hypothetical protein [Endozoicomonas lisbonensis]|uniref:hypothetical protein n=1 Tax=Endozoicomonas lisbonensis TaxID=3120522 RepID=UPI0033926C24